MRRCTKLIARNSARSLSFGRGRLNAAQIRKATERLRAVPPNVITGDTTRMSRLQGQPVILFMFKPTSPTVRHLLAYADEIHSAYAGKVHVLALATLGVPSPLNRASAVSSKLFPVMLSNATSAIELTAPHNPKPRPSSAG